MRPVELRIEHIRLDGLLACGEMQPPDGRCVIDIRRSVGNLDEGGADLVDVPKVAVCLKRLVEFVEGQSA